MILVTIPAKDNITSQKLLCLLSIERKTNSIANNAMMSIKKRMLYSSFITMPPKIKIHSVYCYGEKTEEEKLSVERNSEC